MAGGPDGRSIAVVHGAFVVKPAGDFSDEAVWGGAAVASASGSPPTGGTSRPTDAAALEQQGHDQFVFIPPVVEDGPPLDALADEPEPLVQPDGPRVGGVHLQLQ